MAPPLQFTPKPLELRSALEVELAPAEHAEALINLYHLLREAQDHGWLDAARGAIAGADTAVTQVAKYANTPEGITMMRNLVSMAKILGAIDPEVLQGLSAAIADSRAARQRPSIWKVFRLALTPEVITGAAFALGIVAALGKALNKR